MKMNKKLANQLLAGQEKLEITINAIILSTVYPKAAFDASSLRWRLGMPSHILSWSRFRSVILSVLLLASIWSGAVPASAASTNRKQPLALTPPMGWNDWAHYQCNYSAQTIIDNAKALVKTGLAARGYKTVTIDDCWMQKDRNAQGNLRADPRRFPDGIQPVIQAVHALGLKFGIYEDAGYSTCAEFAGSGQANGGGKDHFAQDAKLFALWGVDYLKLDGCNVYVPKGGSQSEAYRKAYAAQSAALKSVSRPIVFSESAPAYFQGTPDWYDVLNWVRGYGQLWREGTDIDTFDLKKPNTSRFHSVLWNYAYNLPLGRFQKPGNWNDPDFIIGGDRGMSAAETRSQLSLWSMMSAPLILSSDLNTLSPQSIAILGNKNVIAIDQDALGRMATLVRRSSTTDILFKTLSGGDYAIAVLNRSAKPIQVEQHPADFGFAASANCRLDTQNLWSGTRHSSVSMLKATVAIHDTEIWRVHATSACGVPMRTGTITITAAGEQDAMKGYTRCLASPGSVAACVGTSSESWTVPASGTLKSQDRCLAAVHNNTVMQTCTDDKIQRWNYNRVGNLVNIAEEECLTAREPHGKLQELSIQPCGHNRPDQIWSLPN